MFIYSFTRILENLLHNFVTVMKLRLRGSAETKNAYGILMGGISSRKTTSRILVQYCTLVNRIRDRWNWLQVVFSGEM